MLPTLTVAPTPATWMPATFSTDTDTVTVRHYAFLPFVSFLFLRVSLILLFGPDVWLFALRESLCLTWLFYCFHVYFLAFLALSTGKGDGLLTPSFCPEWPVESVRACLFFCLTVFLLALWRLSVNIRGALATSVRPLGPFARSRCFYPVARSMTY